MLLEIIPYPELFIARSYFSTYRNEDSGIAVFSMKFSITGNGQITLTQSLCQFAIAALLWRIATCSYYRKALWVGKLMRIRQLWTTVTAQNWQTRIRTHPCESGQSCGSIGRPPLAINWCLEELPYGTLAGSIVDRRNINPLDPDALNLKWASLVLDFRGLYILQYDLIIYNFVVMFIDLFYGIFQKYFNFRK